MNLDCKTKLFCADKPGVVVTFSETYLTVTCYQWLCDLYAEKENIRAQQELVDALIERDVL